jgi:hypothetical protein
MSESHERHLAAASSVFKAAIAESLVVHPPPALSDVRGVGPTGSALRPGAHPPGGSAEPQLRQLVHDEPSACHQRAQWLMCFAPSITSHVSVPATPLSVLICSATRSINLLRPRAST